MKVNKKVVSIATAATMLLGTASFAAVPENSVVLGNDGYSVDLLFGTDYLDDINTSLADAGDALYYNLGDGWKDIFSGDAITDVQIAEWPEVEYTTASGATVKYAAGNGDEVVPSADGYALSINEAELAAATLSADGKTVMRVEAAIAVPEGMDASEFVGKAKFESKQGLKSAQADAAFDKGKVVFNVTLPNSVEDLEDEIKVVITEHENVELKGLATETIALTYKGYDPAGGVIDQKVYSIDSVKSTDMADRVDVYVGNVDASNIEAVKAAVIDQVKIYNDNNLDNAIDIVDIVKTFDLGDSDYAFRALIDLKPYDATGYDREVLAENALTDNQYNYYEVVDSSEDIRLKDEAKSLDNKFMLIDGNLPNIETVKAPTEDDDFLPPNTLLATFDEPVNRLTAETPANWVLNGHKLEAEDVRYIRVMDIASEEDVDGKELLEYTAVQEDKERNSVFISLKSSAAAKYLEDGENLIQARSIADIAGLTDLSDNNKITTQDFIFNYVKPATDPAVEIEMESPEQYVLGLTEALFTDEESTVDFDMTAAGAVKVELLSKDTKTLIEDVTAESRIVALPGGDNEYILELTEDWTKILTEPTAYHNKFFRVTVIQDVYDVYGVKVEEEGVTYPLYAEVQVPEDTTSPKVAEVLDYIGSTSTNDEGLNVYEETYGHMEFEMDEPVQLFTNDNLTGFMMPAPTVSTVQEAGAGVPVPTFEYVKIEAFDADPLYSEGQKVDGELYNGSVDEHDTKFYVKPTKELDKGEWKLVVRQISDDVGNTMATEEFPFVVGEAEVSADVNPYIVWAYADDDKVNEDGSMNDYVYILYSRQMGIDAIRAATYNINGKQLTQDADITSEDLVLYGDADAPTKYYGLTYSGEEYMPEWKGQFVTIKLPDDFIVGGDDIDGDRDALLRKNALTVPVDFAAIDDEVDTTADTLLFSNNDGSNQYELKFDENEGVTGIAGTYPVPAITYAENLEYQTVNKYIIGDDSGEDEDELPEVTTEVKAGLTAFDRLVEVTLDTDNDTDYAVSVDVNGTVVELSYIEAADVFRGVVTATDEDAIKAGVEVVKIAPVEMPEATTEVKAGLTAFDRLVEVTLDTEFDEDYMVVVEVNGEDVPLSYIAAADVFRGVVTATDETAIENGVKVSLK